MSQCQEGKEKSKQSLGCNVGCNAAQIHSDVLSTETAGKCTGQALEGKAQRASSQDRLILVMCSVPSSKGRACKEQRERQTGCRDGWTGVGQGASCLRGQVNKNIRKSRGFSDWRGDE